MPEQLESMSDIFYNESIFNLILLIVGTILFISALIAYYFSNMPYYLYPIAIGGYAVYSLEFYTKYTSLKRLSLAYRFR